MPVVHGVDDHVIGVPRLLDVAVAVVVAVAGLILNVVDVLLMLILQHIIHWLQEKQDHQKEEDRWQ